MSLHVELSPEALERLRMQRRNSTISSCLVAFLFVVLVGLVLGFFLLNPMVKEPPVIVTYQSNTPEDDTLEERKVQTNMERKPSSPSASMTKVIVSSTVSDVAIPVPEVDVATPSLDFGDGDEFGTGWGDGTGSGGGFSNIPATMNKRCTPQDRLSRLRETGGTPECEAAVVKALYNMKGTQEANGSWMPGFNPAGMTGLALLAYLGHCETPQSPEFGETVSKAITYLVNLGLKNKGILTSTGSLSGVPPVYEHGICTYALAEAYTLCKGFNITIPDLDKVVEKAGDIILEGQTPQGSWVYGYGGSGGDNSVGFWQIQALKACKHTGIWRDSKYKKVIKNAHEWLGNVQGANGAIGYRNDSQRSPGLTGGGVLAFQMWDEGNSKEARKGIKYISDNVKFNWAAGGDQSNLYYHYYHVQAMINEGGREWDKYNEMFRDSLLKAQQPDGSWPIGGGGTHGARNVHMATCLATLMLEVYYRFLPGTGGK
jgi:hypothetical protein